jgi:hypothetical protein
MDFVELNNFVSMYEKPVLGSVSSKEKVMALSVDKSSDGSLKGIARKILDREGSVDEPGFIDISELILVESESGLDWKEKGVIKFSQEEEVVGLLSSDRKFFLGFEDPDIISKGSETEVFFTIAFKYNDEDKYDIYLGNSTGPNLTQLNMNKPVLGPIGDDIFGFKEVCACDEEKDGKKFYLTEMGVGRQNRHVSVISSVQVDSGKKEWVFDKIVADPDKLKIDWCGGHLSPCTLFSRTFLDYGVLRVGILNGREKEKTVDGKKIYGKFRPGLFLFNPVTGEIPWISKEPLFEDPGATTITFASDFLQTGDKEGLLYCHVNDSFIRAYKLRADKIKELLPNKLD